MTYWRLHYHLIWATFEREPGITPEREKIFYGVLYNKAKEVLQPLPPSAARRRSEMGRI